MIAARRLWYFLSADPETLRAALRASQLGVKSSCRGNEGMRHVMADAAEAIGCQVDDLDLSRAHHVTVIRRVMIAMIEDDIAAQRPDASTDQSTSSYSQPT